MKPNIVFLDAYTTDNKGDMFSSWSTWSNLTLFDYTTDQEAATRLIQADIAIVNKFVIKEEHLTNAKNLKYIVVAATGYNNIDIPLMKKYNIKVSNVTDYSTDSVVQHVFSTLLSVLNHSQYYFDEVKKGRWQSNRDFCFYDHDIPNLSQLTLGIIGLGNIGLKLATVANAFGMSVMTNSHQPRPRFVTQCRLDSLLSMSDIISVHTTLRPETHHLVNSNFLQKMKPNAILINTGRGPLINEDDLYHHLSTHSHFKAILDVLSIEPAVKNHPLIPLKNCFITPHIAWADLYARQTLVEGLKKNILHFLEDHPIRIVVD
jgi:glycerate dehydrogenase